MEDNNQIANKIYFLQSNNFVEEYLNQLPINEELKANPRYQSIIWYISSMLKNQNIPLYGDEAKNWIKSQIHIGKNGEVGYILAPENNYYPSCFHEGVQFVQYSCIDGQVRRQVKEIEGAETSLEILSYYNQDGIEEKQELKDYDCQKIFVIERMKNRPELRMVAEYNMLNQQPITSFLEKRTFWVGLEDFSPSLMEVDPLETMPLFKFGQLPPIYKPFSESDIAQVQMMKNKIFPLAQAYREKDFQYYQDLNRQYGRTSVFEKGMAKLFCVRDRVR